MEILSKISQLSYSVKIKNITMHITTLSAGIIGFFEIPISTVKPSDYKFVDLETLIQSVVDT